MSPQGAELKSEEKTSRSVVESNIIAVDFDVTRNDQWDHELAVSDIYERPKVDLFEDRRKMTGTLPFEMYKYKVPAFPTEPTDGNNLV